MSAQPASSTSAGKSRPGTGVTIRVALTVRNTSIARTVAVELSSGAGENMSEWKYTQGTVEIPINLSEAEKIGLIHEAIEDMLWAHEKTKQRVKEPTPLADAFFSGFLWTLGAACGLITAFTMITIVHSYF